jgi:hypothetical protein
VGKDNGDALIDHFMDMAQLQANHVEQQLEQWQGFVNYFGSLKWEKNPDKKKKKRKKVKILPQDNAETS